MIGEQPDEQGGGARSVGTEMVHRHHLDHSSPDDDTRDEAVDGRLHRFVEGQLDHAPDVVVEPFTDTNDIDTGAQQQRRRVDRPSGADHPVGCDRFAIGGDHPGRPTMLEPNGRDRSVGQHVEVRPRACR